MLGRQQQPGPGEALSQPSDLIAREIRIHCGRENFDGIAVDALITITSRTLESFSELFGDSQCHLMHDVMVALVTSSQPQETVDLQRRRLPQTANSPKRCPTSSTAQSSASYSSCPAARASGNAYTPGKRERDCLLLALFAYGGLRHSELLGLDWDDIDLERRLVRVRHAKGRRQRTVPIHPGLVPLFLAYRATRTPLQGPAVFVGVLGRRLSPRSSPGHSATTQPPQASTSTSVTPHTLRHVSATELLSAGAKLRQIQELLGHKHLDSTQRYTRVNAHQLRGATKRLPWTDHSPTSRRGR
jgi:hypothetical protein